MKKPVEPKPVEPKMPVGKYKGTMNEYDARRPKKQVLTRLSK